VAVRLAGIAWSLRAGCSGDRTEVGQGFPDPSIPPLGPTEPPALLTPGLYPAPKVAYTTYPHLVPRLKKEHSYTSTPPVGVHGVFWGEVYLYFYQ